MKKNRSFLTLSLLLFVSCSTMKIQSDFDPKANFSALKTFNWLPDPQKKTGDPLIDENTLLQKRITDAVERTLIKKGYVKEENDTPDFQIGYFAAVNEKVDVTYVNQYYHYGPGWGTSYWGNTVGTSHPHSYTYDVGTLVLDIVSPNDNQLLWRGSAQAELGSKKATPEKSEERINAAVGLIFQKFPPK